MIINIIIFASALFLAFLLISIKAVELKCGKRNSAFNLLCRLDHKSEKLVDDLKLHWHQLTQSGRYLISVRLKILIKNWIVKIIEKVINEYKNKQSTIMGHRDIILGGTASSFYLKKIAETRNGDKGKIEDNSINYISEN